MFPLLLIKHIYLDIKYLQEKIETIFSQEGLVDCFWVDGKIQGQKIEVFIDKDGGISFDICKKISRALEAEFDANLIFGDNYILEVSSPGVGSPLKLERQYKNNIGRSIEVTTQISTLLGILKSVDEGIIEVETEEISKEGNKKIRNTVLQKIAISDIKLAEIKISFK